MIKAKYRPIGYGILFGLSGYGLTLIEGVQHTNQPGFVSSHGEDIIGMGFVYSMFRLVGIPPKTNFYLMPILGIGWELFTEIVYRLGHLDWGGDPKDIFFYGATTGLLVFVDNIYKNMFTNTKIPINHR